MFFVYFGVNNVGLIFDGCALQILQRLGLLKAVKIAVFDDRMYCRFTPWLVTYFYFLPRDATHSAVMRQ